MQKQRYTLTCINDNIAKGINNDRKFQNYCQTPLIICGDKECGCKCGDQQHQHRYDDLGIIKQRLEEIKENIINSNTVDLLLVKLKVFYEDIIEQTKIDLKQLMNIIENQSIVNVLYKNEMKLLSMINGQEQFKHNLHYNNMIQNQEQVENKFKQKVYKTVMKSKYFLTYLLKKVKQLWTEDENNFKDRIDEIKKKNFSRKMDQQRLRSIPDFPQFELEKISTLQIPKVQKVQVQLLRKYCKNLTNLSVKEISQRALQPLAQIYNLQKLNIGIINSSKHENDQYDYNSDDQDQFQQKTIEQCLQIVFENKNNLKELTISSRDSPLTQKTLNIILKYLTNLQKITITMVCKNMNEKNHYLFNWKSPHLKQLILKHQSQLDESNHEYNKRYQKGPFKWINTFLFVNPQLRKLDLNSMYLSAKTFNSLDVVHTNLRHIIFSNNKLQRHCLIKMVQCFPYIQTLQICNSLIYEESCQINDAALQIIVTKLKYLRHLNINNNNISDQGIILISKYSKMLQELSIMKQNKHFSSKTVNVISTTLFNLKKLCIQVQTTDAGLGCLSNIKQLQVNIKNLKQKNIDVVKW